MKKILLMAIAIACFGCTEQKPKMLAELTDNEIKINVQNYIDSVSNGVDLAFVNYQIAYEKEGATAPIFSEINIANDGEFGKVAESSVLLGNTSSLYKVIAGRKAMTAGISFKLNKFGKPISHQGYLIYYDGKNIVFDMTKSADHLSNYFISKN